MKQKVDVLLTTYNTHIPYLKEQIDSILNQTYKEINLLISDDASDIRIQRVLKDYEKKDSRIKLYLQRTNLGYIMNYDFLLKQSKAPYIMFADHDDVWHKDKVKKSLEKLKTEKLDMVYCNATQINEKGEIIKEDYFKYKNVPLVKGTKDHLAMSRCVGIACSQIFTRKVKEKMIPFTSKVMAHDWLAAFIASEGKGIDYIEERLFGYRLHNANVFGGRNLSQNLKRWKEENGKSYKSYLKYRNQKVIDKAYLDGVEMCLQYATKKESKEFLSSAIKYYKRLKKCKFINFHLIKYFKILAGKNQGKKMVKEVVIFHFPILGYVKFLVG